MTMRYKLLGRSGLRVSELCLGAMTFGQDWGWGASADEARQIFDAFMEAGGNFIDTANYYTNGTSERFLGEMIRSERDRFVVATKYTLGMRERDPNASGNHRKNLAQSLEASLERLGTDYIDLYWVHAWDSFTPVDELMRALDDQVRAGKVLYVGISDVPAWIVSQANTMAELRGWSPFAGLQVEYSLVQRGVERDLLPMARALDLGVTAWSPLGGGVLTGKYNRGANEGAAPADARLTRMTGRLSERNLKIAEEVGSLAAEIDRTPSQVALNWIRQQPGGPIPIVGARRLSQARDNLACLEFRLTPEQIDRLDTASRIELGFPHDFLASDATRNLVHGGMYAEIE